MSWLAQLQTSPKAASIGIVIGGALWGLFWLPIRAFEELGFTGAWPGLILYISALALLLPLVLIQRHPVSQLGNLALVGLLTGTAFSFYGTSIILTDVVRALLFFYLTPIWGTAIGVLFLSERLTAARIIAIVLALTGLLAVIGFGSRSAINLGDVLALASGICWTIGTYKIYQLEKTPPLHLSFAFVTGAVLVTVVTLLIGGARLGGTAEIPDLSALWPVLILTGLFALPMIYLTIWPAKVLTPGRIGILLMSEVLVGFGSVALLAGDPFGWVEVLGAVLIISATLVELLGNRATPERAIS